jgi:hypothetical protein
MGITVDGKSLDEGTAKISTEAEIEAAEEAAEEAKEAETTADAAVEAAPVETTEGGEA